MKWNVFPALQSLWSAHSKHNIMRQVSIPNKLWAWPPYLCQTYFMASSASVPLTGAYDWTGCKNAAGDQCQVT